ncbi:NAD-binding protein [Schizopora paradoxa]|uniref:NAD-binding protein n=1 Tax=Schizopora paradoxa TaxID=27342 RepID=A0A0H2RHN1_9AGAM|nr:NAD-binding protein [Schizopora paradoxa]
MVSYVVTGANRGIGLEFVRQLSVGSDNSVFAIVRDKSRAAKLEGLGRKNVYILEADVTDRAAIQTAVKQVSEVTGGTLDVLINNAAFIGDGREMYGLSSYPPEVEDKIGEDLLKAFNVNVVGTVTVTNLFLPLLRVGKLKKVIMISTAAADAEFTRKVEHEGVVPYSVSKAALNMVVEKYAQEKRNREEGFTFLALAPGAVDTREMEGVTDPEQIEEMKKMFDGIVSSLQKAVPTFEGLATPERAVTLMLEVIEKAEPGSSRSFLSQYGNKEWL